MNNSDYEWPYNGSKLISKDVLKPFLQRNNINGLIHLGMHLGLIFLSGGDCETTGTTTFPS